MPESFNIKLLRSKQMPDGRLHLSGSVHEARIDADGILRLLYRSDARLAIFYVALDDNEYELVLDDALLHSFFK